MTLAEIFLDKVSSDSKGLYTEHSIRVSKYLSRMFNVMYTSKLACEFQGYTNSTIFLAGLLHDIGKEEIPAEILSKPTSLDEQEWEVMKTHAAKGMDILSRPTVKDIIRDFFSDAQLDVIQNVAYTHHCRVDGNGYPKTSEKMSSLAKLCAIADTYDAITEDRPYRKGASHEKAVSIIEEAAGTQLDEDMVRVLAANNWEF